METGASSSFWVKEKELRYPRIQLSPELIFGNQIELLSIDFIGSPSGTTYAIPASGNGRQELRTIIATWYVTLRTIAIVGLLSVLVYIGIRIIISSASQDKAKYKQRLIDWVVAFCLLFFMHYIMAGTINVVNKVDEVLLKGSGTDAIALDPNRGNIKHRTISSGTVRPSDEVIAELVSWFQSHGITLDDTNPPMKYPMAGGGYSSSVYWQFKKNGVLICELVKTSTYVPFMDPTTSYSITGTGSGIITSEQRNELNTMANSQVAGGGAVDDGSTIKYFINYARLYVNANEKDANITVGFGFLILYIVLIVFTGMFLFRYVKRVIYIAFLTMIAPLVALTYPLDKIKDRKSSGF